MRLFPPIVEIDQDEGFSPQKDIFGRKQFADNLTSLLSKVDDPLVLALDGQWGSGKTVFLKMWMGDLKKAGFPVIYFDAFENDYFDDAFIPLAAEVVSLAQQKLKEKTNKVDALKEKSKKAAKVIARSTLKIGIRAMTIGALNVDDIESDVADEIEAVFDKHIGELITKQESAKSDLQAFRDALQALPQLLAPAEIDANLVKPLVLIIDELDRCRPNYALQLLERVKHFFSVPNVHFVLGTSLSQLRNSVVAIYGSGIDSSTYLQKFIHLSVQFPEQQNPSSTTVSQFLTFLVKNSGVTDKDLGAINTCTKQLSWIATRLNLSLRTIEQVFGHILRVVVSNPKNQFLMPPIVVGLALLKVTSPELFAQAKDSSLDYKAAAPKLGLLDSNHPEINYAGSPLESKLVEQNWLESWWRYIADEKCPKDIVEKLDSALFQYSFGGRMSLLSWTANQQIDRFS